MTFFFTFLFILLAVFYALLLFIWGCLAYCECSVRIFGGLCAFLQRREYW